MTELFRLVQKDSGQAAAIVGMTKNVGKTVTLNSLISDCEKEGLRLGLVSAGYDGERFDRLTLKDKPRIYAPKGAFIATAKACFDAADAELDLLEVSSFSTPLGPVCIAVVKNAGLVELAGPGNTSSLRSLTMKMTSLGATKVLVDGAINRIASASPQVTDSTILASGASLGPTMDDVIQKTVFRKDLLTTSQVNNLKLLQFAREGISQGGAALLNRNYREYAVETVQALTPMLAGAKLLDRCRNNTEALVYGGALVDGSLLDLMSYLEDLPLVIVQDGTRLFISSDVYKRFLSRGGKIAVIREINLLAVTVNPTDPCGRGYDPCMFLERMREALNPLPVFDLILETAG